jgi:dTDP-D-glucose 4,6-dehydratase
MQHDRAFAMDAASLRDDLAAMERQIRFNPGNHDLIRRYVTYARKVREIEFRETGYVTARHQPSERTSAAAPLSPAQVSEDSPCC